MSSLEQSIFYNLGSLILGLAALLLAGFAFGVRPRSRSKSLTAFSFCLCALSLLLQIAEIDHRVQINDFAAIADTIRAVRWAASALFVLTAAGNAAALIRHRGD